MAGTQSVLAPEWQNGRKRRQGEAANWRRGRLCYVETEILDREYPGPARSAVAASWLPGGVAPEPDRTDPPGDPRHVAVSALYQAHALGLVRLAHIMLGDADGAEDVVQDAFCGLYQRWALLADPGRALQYVRSAVLNGCRSALRRRIRHGRPGTWSEVAAAALGVPSAESAVLDGEDHRAVLAALQRLPHRQREALVLHYYLDMPEAEIAATMGISPGSVRSARSRALGALGRLLEESR
jgi:RNA polymerase sigma-70 factor (sigma-E family)